MGFFSDRISARVALMINFVGAGLAMVMIFGAANPVMLAPFVAIFGFTLGAPLVLVPLLTADALGLKRFGSIGGIAGVFNTAGAFVGPIALGRIFDVTGSYRGAFEICLLMCGFGLVASFSCLTYDTEHARAQGRRVASAAA